MRNEQTTLRLRVLLACHSETKELDTLFCNLLSLSLTLPEKCGIVNKGTSEFEIRVVLTKRVSAYVCKDKGHTYSM